MIKNKIKNGKVSDLPTTIVELLQDDYFELYGTCDGFFENLEIWIQEEGIQNIIEYVNKISNFYDSKFDITIN